jgi:hypothetical protein
MLNLKATVGIIFMALAVIIIATDGLNVHSEDVLKNCINITR